MRIVDLILTAIWIVPIRPSNNVFTDYAIVIDQGIIIDILPRSETTQRYQARAQEHFPNHCLMPGLINNHTHSAMGVFSNQVTQHKLITWLNNYVWPIEKHSLNQEMVQSLSELAIACMMRNGISCFSDMYFFADGIAKVVDKTGIRANLGMLILNLASAQAEQELDYFSQGQQLHDHYRHHDRITTAYAPHAPYTLTDRALSQIMINAEELDLPIRMLLHQTKDETNQSLEQFGQRPLARLHQLGLLSPRLNAVHMSQLTEQEILLCAETGIHIVHCPQSNLRWGHGQCPIQSLLKHQIPITLGTDSQAINPSLDMFAEIRQVGLQYRVGDNPESRLTSASLLEFATINSAKALGLDHQIGSLEVGKAADIIAIDLADWVTPVKEALIDYLVYGCRSQQVSDLWIAGEARLRGGQLTTINLHQVQYQARQWAQRIKENQ